jgi:hypothetical protein
MQVSEGTLTILTDVFHDLTQALHANAITAPELSTSHPTLNPIHHPLNKTVNQRHEMEPITILIQLAK